MSEWVDFGELKRQVPVEWVLEGYGWRLKRVRRQYLRGRCPLPSHRSLESRESFGVDTAKNVWACHSDSCRAARHGQVGGTILDLVAELEGCSLREAGLRLQRSWGRGQLVSEGSGELVSKGSGELVAKGSGNPRWEPLPEWRFRLHLEPDHAYLRGRGIERQTAAAFGVGYYGGRGWLRGRVGFPLHDEQGRLVGYAGRAVDGGEPRYLFPPGLAKSRVVFNLHRAALTGSGAVVVVEGFFDCLRVHQAGCPTVVALLGTSLSPFQRQQLRERFAEVVLMLDGDAAGRQASQRLAAGLGGTVSWRMARVPDGRQPDELSQEEIREILNRAAA